MLAFCFATFCFLAVISVEHHDKDSLTLPPTQTLLPHRRCYTLGENVSQPRVRFPVETTGEKECEMGYTLTCWRMHMWVYEMDFKGQQRFNCVHTCASKRLQEARGRQNRLLNILLLCFWLPVLRGRCKISTNMLKNCISQQLHNFLKYNTKLKRSSQRISQEELLARPLCFHEQIEVHFHFRSPQGVNLEIKGRGSWIHLF